MTCQNHPAEICKFGTTNLHHQGFKVVATAVFWSLVMSSNCLSAFFPLPQIFGRAAFASIFLIGSTYAEQRDMAALKSAQANRAELVAWAAAAARDSQLSGDPLARAMANDMTQVLALAQGTGPNPQSARLDLLDANDLITLYDVRAQMPLRLWHLWASCTAEPGPQCRDPELEKSLIAGDVGNAFVLLVVQGVMDSAARTQMYTELSHAAAQDPCNGGTSKTAGTAQAKENCGEQAQQQRRDDAYQHAEEKLQAAQSVRRAEWLKRFDVANRYDDFAQAFKAPLQAVVKKRPLPPSWTALAQVPTEYLGLLEAFPQHQWMAELLSNAVVGAATTMSVPMICAPTAVASAGAILTGAATASAESSQVNAQTVMSLDAAARKNVVRCERLAELVLRNPKNSAASAVVVLTNLQNHPMTLRMAAFGTLERRKKFEPSDLFKFDWVGLREILARASIHGDIAAIPNAFAWADAQTAKLAEKTAQDLAKEADERKALEVSPDRRHDEPVSPDRRHDEPVSPDGRHDEPVSPDRRHDEPVSPDGRHDEPVSPDGRGNEPVSPDGRGDKPVSPDGRGDKPVSPDGRGDKPIEAVARENI
jgi:hypothetical protein